MDKSKRSRYQEIATTRDGRDITRGWIDEQWYLHPQDKVLLYRGAGNYELYEEVLRDDRVKSALSQRRGAVVARETRVTPGGPRRRDRMAADFMQEVLTHIRWDTVSDRMLYGVFYGFSVAEALYVRDGGHVMLDQVRVRNRRRFVFDPYFRPKLLTMGNALGEALPEKKFWTFATGADNDDEPYGRGLAHYLYWPAWFKKNHTRFWLTFLEKFGSPTVIGRYNSKTATAEEKAELMAALRAVNHDTGITIPEDVMIELLEAARSGTVDYAAFYDKMNAAITTVILSQTMTTEDGSSQSQAQVHMNVRDEIVTADACLVCDSFSRSIATWLTQWNFPGAAVPHISRIADSGEALQRLASRDKTIVEMGHRLSREYVENTYGVTLAPADETAALQPAPGTEEHEEENSGNSAQFAEDDPVLNLLATRTREDVGPKVDALVEQARAELDTADSLAAWRDWLDTESVANLSLAPLEDALAPARMAAYLTGWSDSEDNSVAFADADTARLPFDEQIRFFRRKLALPTERWTDLWLSQHDVAFVVAGATRDDLLSDLRGAVDAAIADGETLAAFRKRFDSIVTGHGWDYNGGRDWRSRVIYETNLRTSYAAGRYQQMQAVKAQRPYWRYRHSHASENPREHHLAWDGLVLDADDPWWQTHYPPNGWGCKCYVETLSQRDLARLDKEGVDPAPRSEKREWINKDTGETHQVPLGIDPGWAYAPGTSAVGAAQQHSINTMEKLLHRAERGGLPEGAVRMAQASVHATLASEPFARFVRTTRPDDNQHWPVAALSPKRTAELGLPEHSRIVRLSSHDTAGHRDRYATFTGEDWTRVQRLVERGHWVEDRPNHRVLWLNEAGKDWMIAIKRSAQEEIFLVSYYRLREEQRVNLERKKRGSDE